MRYICILATILVTALLARAEVAAVNGVCVVVNDAVITFEQVESEIMPVAETLATQYRSDPKMFEQKVQQLRREKIEEMVQEKLILHEFKVSGLQLPESYIEDMIQDRIRKEYYGDRARLTRSLQLRGQTYEMFYQMERDRFIVYQMTKQFISPDKILISPSKIEAYYNSHTNAFNMDAQVKLRMIVINQSPIAEPGTAEKMAGEVLRLLDQGVPFAELAGVYSSGSQRANGGDRGWVERSYFKPELAEVAFSLKPGQHSKVVTLGESCYILQVDDVRPAHIRTLSEVRLEVETTLKDQEKRRLKDRWIQRLKNKSYIRYFN